MAEPIRQPVRIGTRGSELALWQANLVSSMVQSLGLTSELVLIKTSGDLDLSRPLAELGQQTGEVGLFTKEIQRKLLNGEVDLAVHSLKDLPTDVTPGLVLAARPVRAPVTDLLLIHPDAVDESDPVLPIMRGARVGTSSVRRRVQLLERRPDLQLLSVRGNVPTRLGKARSREVDAVVLAAAGIDRLRLDMTGVRRVELPADRFVCAPGQGALGIEARAGDAALLAALARLDDAAVRDATDAERDLLQAIGAGCSVPLGAHAVPDVAGHLVLRAVLGPAEAPDPGVRPWLRRALVRGPDARAAAALAHRILGELPPPRPAEPSVMRGRRVLVLREGERARELVQAIEALGGHARCHAPTEDRELNAPALGEVFAAIAPDGWVAFASGSAVRHLVRALAPGAADMLRARRVAAVGPSTARALADADVPVDLLAADESGAGLAAALLAHFGDTRPPVLLPAAKGGRPELGEALTAAGCHVRRVELYEATPLPPPTTDELAVDAIVVASPSGARGALGGCARASLQARIVAIGPTTADAVRALGLEVAAVAEHPTTEGVLHALSLALGG